MDFKTRLKELGLNWMSENADIIIASAKDGRKSHADMLAALIDGERTARMARAALRRFRTAKVPVRKSLSEFNWLWPKKIDQDIIKDIFRMGFLKDHGNVVFMGAHAVGFTASACSPCGI